MDIYEPKGKLFFDQRSERDMILVEEGPWEGWICYRHPDGQWVSLRKATLDDQDRLMRAQSVPGFKIML